MTNLKKHRTEKGLSQSELASKSGISVRLIQCYEQRNRNINNASADTVYKLAQALNTTIESILEH